MPRKPPKYMLHKPSGQARVRIGGRDIYLGPYDSTESYEQYDAVLAKFLTGRQLNEGASAISISRLCLNYVAFAKGYYRKDGQQTAEVCCIQMALKLLISIYGSEKISGFGPLKLKAVREEMTRRNWARKTINKSVQRIVRMLRWGTENECVDPSVYQACRAVTGLRRGRCEARETGPVQPVPQAEIDAVELFVSRQVWAMIQLQLCTGMRPGEVCILRARDLDRSGDVWTFTPQTHKTAHHGRQRLIFIGPRGQEILQPYLASLEDDGYVFRPDAAEKARNQLRKSQRKSPMTPSQAKRKPKATPKKSAGEHYLRTSYTRAITRACKLAKVNEWAPNQLRHNAATELRKKHGLEGTRTVLGHSTTDMTEIYAEIDFDTARKIMRSSG